MKFRYADVQYTDEMEDFFVQRTMAHIHSVQKYCQKIERYDPERFKGLRSVAEPHDSDKLNNPIERVPYIFITWMYRCKLKGIPYEPPEEMKKPMDEATAYHIKNNKHHPEYWSPVTTNLVNPDARDEASQVIDTTKMPLLYVGEMVADWFSVGKERGNPVKWWADKNVNKRWMFTPEQTKTIYELLENVK